MSPEVSILTSVKADSEQAQDWLGYAIKSVLAQTYPDWEMVIVDDGSSIDLSLVRERYGDERIRWLEGGEGVVASRNLAAKQSQGRFLLPLDADDKLAKNALELFLEGWEEGGGDQGIVYSDVMVFGQDFSRLIQTRNYSFDQLLRTNYIAVGSLHLKSDWERIGGWHEDMEDGLEDWEYWIRMGEAGVCGCRVEQPLYWYRRHPNGRLSKLRSEQDHWNSAYAAMRDLHVDTYNGRRPMGCCGGAGGTSSSTQEAPTVASGVGDDSVVMTYSGDRQGSFYVRGRSSGIKYRIQGTGAKFEVHPDDVSFLQTFSTMKIAEVQPEKEVQPPEEDEKLEESYDTEMLNEATALDELEKELARFQEAQAARDAEEVEVEPEPEPEPEPVEAPDPADFTVMEMRSADFDVTPEQAEVMLDMERRGKDRSTAIKELLRKL